MPFLHAGRFMFADVIKSNQVIGADVALGIARFWCKPFIVRCGYLPSCNVAIEKGNDSEKTVWTRSVEDLAFAECDAAIVTTDAIRKEMASRIPGASSRIYVQPNYVDAELFSPCPSDEPVACRVCFIGRLAREKNLSNLIRAALNSKIELDIIGAGPTLDELNALAAGNPRIRLLGSVEHSQLPRYLRKASLFVLPSLYEGNPKTLIEAMACGLAVVGSDVEGIRSVIEHEENGLLCGTDEESLRAAMDRVLDDEKLRCRLGKNARQYVLEHCALDVVAAKELEILAGLIAPLRKKAV